MVEVKELPILVTMAFIIIFLPLLFLFTASSQARLEGLVEIGSLFSDGAILLLFMVVFSLGVLGFIRQGAFGEAPDLLSGGSSQLIGTGLIAFLVIWTVFLSGAGAVESAIDFPVQSILQLPIQSIFSQVGDALVQPYWRFVLIGLAVPLSEELMFGLAIPTLVFAVLVGAARQFGATDIFGEGVTTFLIAIVTIAFSASVFALFHISQQTNLAFVFGSMAFRSISLLFAYSDAFLGAIPILHFGIGGMWGIHIANNVTLLTPLSNFVNVLIAGDGTILSGIFTLAIFGFFILAFASALQTIGDVLNGEVPGAEG